MQVASAMSRWSRSSEMRSKWSNAKSPGHDERSISRTSTASPGLSSIRTNRGTFPSVGADALMTRER